MTVTSLPPRPVDASAGVLDLDLDRPLPAVLGGCANDVRCLLRRGDVPVGVVDLHVPAAGLSAATVADRVAAVAVEPVAAGRAAVPARVPTWIRIPARPVLT